VHLSGYMNETVESPPYHIWIDSVFAMSAMGQVFTVGICITKA
jgi:beta-lactamase class D